MTEGGNITLTIHGLDAERGEVDGEVFAEKFSAFLRGLAICDKVVNGKRKHKFFISALSKNTATAQVAERQYVSAESIRSGVEFYAQALIEVRNNTRSARRLPLNLVESFVSLNKGVGSKFRIGEIKLTNDVIVIDKFFESNAVRVLDDINKTSRPIYFSGVSFGSFDGVFRAVDFQQDQKQGVLRLSHNGAPLKCNITNVALDQIRFALEQRSIVYGLCHYDGTQSLPTMFDVEKIEIIQKGSGLARWRGTFEIEPHEEDTW